VREQPTTSSRLDPLRRRYSWLDHLVRAEQRYVERHGDHYAAGITYFSILALVPLTMVAFAAVTLVLAANPHLLAELRDHIGATLPAELDETLNRIIDQAITAATTVGVIGLLIALYTGLHWMSNLRAALSEQWGQPPRPPPFLRRLRVDLATLIGLGLAMAVSFGVTAAASGFAEQILGLLGLAGLAWAGWALRGLGLLLTLVADWLVFVWVFARLPREPVTWRNAANAAIGAAVGLEVIKQGMVFYLAKVTQTPTGAAFGPILGLVLFMYTVSRFLIYMAAWAATAQEDQVGPPPPPPPPAVIRSEVWVRSAPRAGATAGLVGASALVGLICGQLLAGSARARAAAPCDPTASTDAGKHHRLSARRAAARAAGWRG
jgi:membrane protein